jgi:hypothetical protein
VLKVSTSVAEVAVEVQEGLHPGLLVGLGEIYQSPDQVSSTRRADPVGQQLTRGTALAQWDPVVEVPVDLGLIRARLDNRVSVE